MKFVSMRKKLITIVLGLLMFTVAFANDYKYVRTYDADGNVVATANYDVYIAVYFAEMDMGFETMRVLTWGMYTKYGDNWEYTPAPKYNYYGQNNGWYIFVSTVGRSSDYFYYKMDGSCVRATFMAGGKGQYKEYILAKRPTIDRLGPTR